MIDTSNHMMMIADYIPTIRPAEHRVGGITYIKSVGLGIHAYTATVVFTAPSKSPTVEVETIILYVEGNDVIHTERLNITNL